MNFPTSIYYLLLILLTSVSGISASAQVPTRTSPKCAIVLHGLGRTSGSMKKLERTLRSWGYIVWNESYPSTKQPIESLSSVVGEALSFCKEKDSESIYFVTHSLGGILVRQYFQTRYLNQVKAIVMLAPPNRGSEVADAYKDTLWYQHLLGPAGQELITGPAGLPSALRPLGGVPIGIIAGTVTSDPWFSHLFSGENDGKVSVKSARLDEMKDFLTVPHGHTFIMDADEVVDQVLHFFKATQFKK